MRKGIHDIKQWGDVILGHVIEADGMEEDETEFTIQCKNYQPSRMFHTEIHKVSETNDRTHWLQKRIDEAQLDTDHSVV